MAKKFLTKADEIKDNIEKVKSVIEHYNTIKLEDDDITKKRKFMEERLIELEKLYVHYLETNEPYYEPFSYDYYKNKFKDENKFEDLNWKFVNETEWLVNSDFTPYQTTKILKILLKAYKEKQDELIHRR